jgi:hypothetical protein
MAANLSYKDICFFTVYHSVTKLPVYTKYNFKFNEYKIYSNLRGNVTNIDIFNKFLIENKTDYSKPLNVKSDLIKFFRPINQDTINYIRNYGYTIHGSYTTYYNPETYVQPEILAVNQFTINSTTYYDDTQIRFVQDFLHIEDLSGKIFTKYNFNFDTYSLDFNVWGSKLQIFTDFISRCIKLGNNIVVGSFGYLIPDMFKKYFLDIIGLQDYMVNYGITSNLTTTYKNPNNIDWKNYALQNNFSQSTNIKILKSHYYCNGQFEQVKIKFLVKPLTNNQIISNSVCTIFSSNSYNTEKFYNGFLYKRHGYNGSSIYVITTFEVLKNNPNMNSLKASFSINNNDELSKPVTTTAEFNIIGYDCISNILVAEYNPNATFNKINNVDLSTYSKIAISPEYKINNGQQIFSVSNLGNLNLKNLFNGTVIDKSYGGSFDSKLFLAAADEMIINIPEIENYKGSPVFVCDNIRSSDGNYVCVGMISNSISKNNNNFQTKAVNGNFLFNTAQKIISNWGLFNTIPRLLNNSILFNYYLKLSIPKAWLGTVMSYYNSLLSPAKFSPLINFPYTGGVIIEKFILGIDLTNNKFITNAEDLGKFEIVKLDTPLLNTKIYNRYIESSKTPIIIKSISFYQGLQSEYKTFYFGKYGNQESFYKFTYGMLPIYNKYVSNAFLVSYAYYNTITINYYYYNGSVWVEESEQVGGQDSSWFSSIKDSLGNDIIQHKFQFPFTLLSYQFLNDDYSKMI